MPHDPLLVCKTFNAFLQKQRNAIAKSLEALDALISPQLVDFTIQLEVTSPGLVLTVGHTYLGKDGKKRRLLTSLAKKSAKAVYLDGTGRFHQCLPKTFVKWAQEDCTAPVTTRKWAAWCSKYMVV